MSPPKPDQHWRDWLSGLAERLRRAMLAHPDGARVISASQLFRTMAAISELAMSNLVARAIPLRQARVIVLTVERFTVGHVLEEQAPRPDAEALKSFDMAAFTEQHPTAVAAIAEYFQPGRTVDDLFRDCLEVVIAGAAVKAGTPPDRSSALRQSPRPRTRWIRAFHPAVERKQLCLKVDPNTTPIAS